MDKHHQDKRHWAEEVVSFLERIGLRVERVEAAQVEASFLPSVLVSEGGLKVCMEEAFPGDILHEAAHLAVIPASFRPYANGDLREVENKMAQYLEDNPEAMLSYPEDPLARAVLQAAEAEATAWQYAAAQEIGLPLRWVFPVGSYDGDRVELLRGLRNNAYLGINGLRAAGWTQVRASPYQPDVPVYPKLKFWLQA